MENIKLQASSRQLNQPKPAETVPAELYGPGVDNRHLLINEVVLGSLLVKINKATMIDLVIDNESPVPVLIRDIQRESVKDKIVHIDFFQPDLSKKVKVEIDVRPIGKSLAINNLGAALVKNMQTIQVECLPGDIVPFVEVDLSCLNKVDDVVRVIDISLPAGITAVSQPRAVVFSLAASRRGRMAQADLAAAPTAGDASAKSEESTKIKSKK